MSKAVRASPIRTEAIRSNGAARIVDSAVTAPCKPVAPGQRRSAISRNSQRVPSPAVARSGRPPSA